MLKILLWVVSQDGRFLNGALKILERQHNGVEVVGVTAGVPIQLVKDGKKVDFIPLDKVDGGGDYDLLLVVGAMGIGMSNITQAARQFNLPEEKLLGDWIVCVPGFTLEKYRRLQRSRLSIFSRNCFGSLLSNKLALQFRSPFVNLSLSDEDFIRFMRHPRVYMEEDLIFASKEYSDWEGFDVATFTCGNVSILMNHYRDFDEAVAKWNERKTRINWYNLFVVSFTDSPESLQKFDALPHGKKICFVPFESDLDSAFYVPPGIRKDLLPPDTKEESSMWETVNLSVLKMKFFYDPFDLLLYVKKTRLF